MSAIQIIVIAILAAILLFLLCSVVVFRWPCIKGKHDYEWTNGYYGPIKRCRRCGNKK